MGGGGTNFLPAPGKQNETSQLIVTVKYVIIKVNMVVQLKRQSSYIVIIYVCPFNFEIFLTLGKVSVHQLMQKKTMLPEMQM